MSATDVRVKRILERDYRVESSTSAVTPYRTLQVTHVSAPWLSINFGAQTLAELDENCVNVSL